MNVLCKNFILFLYTLTYSLHAHYNDNIPPKNLKKTLLCMHYTFYTAEITTSSATSATIAAYKLSTLVAVVNIAETPTNSVAISLLAIATT
ncbi:MAG TPA: hypothetical protein VLB80_02440 [Candidatus Babeliales bacterium]|nr:hypothetical protein [Candidatus Babeliales bacterium]